MKKLLIIGEMDVSVLVRFQTMLSYLSEKYEVTYTNIRFRSADGDPELPEDHQDIVVLCRSHRPDIIQRYKDKGSKIVYDIDDDFWAIPKSHPGYLAVGQGNQEWLTKMEEAINLSDMVTVSTPIMKERISSRITAHQNIFITPNGWDPKMNGWPLAPRSYPKGNFVIGWGGTITHRNDFAPLVPHLVKFLKKTNHVDLLIMGDYQIALWFEEQLGKIRFFSGVPYVYYPAALNFFDLMIVPLLDDHFNLAKSDIKLVEAGASYLPWVASDVPFYKDWDPELKSGYIVPQNNPAEFVAGIQKFLDPKTYVEASLVSRELSNLRTADKLSKHLIELYEGL